MLKRAASKIAHSTSMPILAGNLAGNKDLRALQDLITAEKSLMTSLQKLSNDVIKASEALKAWGLGGGFDLGDTLSASAELYLLFATALSHFANHEATVRGHMKAVRSHEENLNELRKRRKSLAAKAGSAERRLEKMNLDNNGFLAQTELLSNLREEIRIMDADIRAEEASLNDFKHLKAKAWMELKFEGLLTCSQKGVIVGESGKLVIADISVGTTEPDLPRTSYTGHARTEHLVAEAQRSINEVVFSIDPNPNPSQHSIRSTSGSNLPSVSPSLQGDQPFRHSFVEDSRRNSSVLQAYADRANTSAIGQESRLSQGPSDHSGLPQVQESSSLSSPSPTDSAQHPTTSALHDIDEFGICPPGSNAHRSSSMRDLGKKAGSPMDDWFAIFPAKVAGPRQPPGASSSSRPSSSICTSPSVHGGEERWLLDVDPPKDLFSTIIAGALGGQWPVENSSTAGPSTSVARAGSQSGKADGVKTSSASYESPPPMYTPLVNLLPDAVPAEQQYWGDHWDQGTSLSEFDREMAQNSEGDHTVTGHAPLTAPAVPRQMAVDIPALFYLSSPALSQNQGASNPAAELMRQSMSKAIGEFECDICFSKYSKEVIATVSGCGHAFCRDCLRTFAVNTVEQRRYPIPCPTCMAGKGEPDGGVLDDFLVQQLGLTEEQYTVFIEMEMAGFSVLLHCRRCQNSAFVDKFEYEDSEFITCPLQHCTYTWCKACSQEVIIGGPKHSCDGSSELKNLMDQRGWKHCPGCQTPVERTEGCNHMTCSAPRCNTHFCYKCGGLVVRSLKRKEIKAALDAHYKACQLFEDARDH